MVGYIGVIIFRIGSEVPEITPYMQINQTTELLYLFDSRIVINKSRIELKMAAVI